MVMEHLKKKAAARNQEALSASNGLALDLRAGTSEFNCGGAEGWRGWVGRQRKGNAFQRRWRPVDLEKKKQDASFFSLGWEKAVWSWNVWQRWQQMRQEASVMKFGCLFSDELRGMIGALHNPRLTTILWLNACFGYKNMKFPFIWVCGWYAALQGFSSVTVGITGAVNYTQCEPSALQHCAICLSWWIRYAALPFTFYINTEVWLFVCAFTFFHFTLLWVKKKVHSDTWIKMKIPETGKGLMFGFVFIMTLFMRFMFTIFFAIDKINDHLTHLNSRVL